MADHTEPSTHDVADAQAERLEERWQALRSKLLAAVAHLRHQGSLVRRRTAKGDCWYVRYYGEGKGKERVQHSIYVGSEPELAHRTRRFIEELRETKREIEHLAGLGRALRRLVPWLAGRRAHRRRSGRRRG